MRHHATRSKGQFDLDGMSATQFEGEPAFRAGPDKLLKLQRRNYRLSVPYDQTIKCTIPLPDQMPVQVEIMDISIGGIGIIGYTPDVPLAAGHGIRELQPQSARFRPGHYLAAGAQQFRFHVAQRRAYPACRLPFSRSQPADRIADSTLHSGTGTEIS